MHPGSLHFEPVTHCIFTRLCTSECYLKAAAVACGGAGQAGDLMHDFKAGLMMRLSPRKQLIAQLLGIPVGILVRAMQCHAM